MKIKVTLLNDNGIQESFDINFPKNTNVVQFVIPIKIKKDQSLYKIAYFKK